MYPQKYPSVSAGKAKKITFSCAFQPKVLPLRRKNIEIVMCNIVNQQTTRIKTQEGQTLARRVTTVRMPNGKYRHPVVYYDITPDVVRVSSAELLRLRVPVYEQLI